MSERMREYKKAFLLFYTFRLHYGYTETGLK